MKKNILRIFLSMLSLLVILVGGFLMMNYASDIPVEELKKDWTYENSQFIEIDGMQVHYRVNGKGHPLVLIHGTAASLHTWEKWTEVLEKDFQVISLDLPAYGLTGPNSEGDYSLDYYSSFLDQFLDQLNIDSFSIAGNSLGGGIAWRYTTLFPGKVQNLVLVNSAGYPRNSKPPFVFRLAKNKWTSAVLKKITLRSMFENSMQEVYYNDNLISEKLVDRYYYMLLREGNRQAFVDRIKSVNKVDISEVKSIKVPTLILWGEHDEWIPVGDASKFAHDIKGSELKIYPNAGHVPMEEIPIETAKDTRDFLFKNISKTTASSELAQQD